MSQSSWSLQDAKNKFSTVVDAALAGEPQLVTRHGKPAVIVVAADTFARLHQLDRERAPSLAEMLLAMPQDDGSFERSHTPPRDVEF